MQTSIYVGIKYACNSAPSCVRPDLRPVDDVISPVCVAIAILNMRQGLCAVLPGLRAALATQLLQSSACAARKLHATSATALKCGFIGLGHMGSRMAAHLMEAGHSLVLFDDNRLALDRAVQTADQLSQAAKPGSPAVGVTAEAVLSPAAVATAPGEDLPRQHGAVDAGCTCVCMCVCGGGVRVEGGEGEPGTALLRKHRLAARRMRTVTHTCSCANAAAAGVSVLFTMLPSVNACRNVYLGPRGILSPKSGAPLTLSSCRGRGGAEQPWGHTGHAGQLMAHSPLVSRVALEADALFPPNPLPAASSPTPLPKGIHVPILVDCSSVDPATARMVAARVAATTMAPGAASAASVLPSALPANHPVMLDAPVTGTVGGAEHGG